MPARSISTAALLVASALLVSCRTPSPIPPEGIDRLRMTVKVDVEIAGIGKDLVELHGDVTVHRSGPTGPAGTVMKGEMLGATLRGKSQVFGEVYATQSPLHPSPCTYTFEGPGRYLSHFDIQGWFWLPEHNLLVSTNEPVVVEGVASGIPPVGQKAESVTKDVPLHDLHKPNAPPIGAVTRAMGEIHRVVRLEGP